MCSHAREAGRATGSHKLRTSSTGKTCSGRGWSSALLPEPSTDRPAVLLLQKLLWSDLKVLPQSSSSIQRMHWNHIKKKTTHTQKAEKKKKRSFTSCLKMTLESFLISNSSSPPSPLPQPSPANTKPEKLLLCNEDHHDFLPKTNQ